MKYKITIPTSDDDAHKGFSIEKDSGGEIVLKKYYGSDKTVVIPEGVTVIGALAFERNADVERVVVTSSVKKIGKQAFYWCPNLREINLPESLEYIGESVFSLCNKLEKINLPKGLTDIPSGVLLGSDIKSIVIPDKVTKIGSYAFCGCKSLESIVLPEGLKIIGNTAFENCLSLENIDIPDGVTEIGKDVFDRCRALRQVIFPPSVEVIGESLFKDCDMLERVVFPEQIKRIDLCIFDNSQPKEIIMSDFQLTQEDFKTFQEASLHKLTGFCRIFKAINLEKGNCRESIYDFLSSHGKIAVSIAGFIERSDDVAVFEKMLRYKLLSAERAQDFLEVFCQPERRAALLRYIDEIRKNTSQQEETEQYGL